VPRLLRIVAVIAVVALPAASAAARPAANPTLVATVGTNDGFDIGLADAAGTPVTILAPGTYDVVVRDRSALHNFHLASNEDPTVDFRTDVELVGEQSFTVTLRDNTRYAYACEPHWQTMNGVFFVSSNPAPPPPTKPPPPPTLHAGVTRGGRAFVAKRSVAAGRYRLVVQDSSRRANFHVAGSGLNRRTGMRFTGRTSWTVRLARGKYRFGSDPGPLRGTLSVR
jgi:plastocyanin